MLEFGKPDWDSVKPGGAGRLEVSVDARPASHSRGDLFGLVGTEIVKQKMQLLVLGPMLAEAL
ncbi:MAG: hypothetical protein RLN85_13340 [Pseudomonadales bacterium]